MLTLNQIKPDWPAPSNVTAYTSCRLGGLSQSPFDSFNIAQHVGDDPDVVDQNRCLLPNSENFIWLNQTHSNICLNFDSNKFDSEVPQGDACFTSHRKQVCAVMTADCLPILLCDIQGNCVAAVHAGWRGLANGIIENTVAKMPVNTKNLIAWLGPAISQKYFEIGNEVKETFSEFPEAFQLNRQSNADKYFADLYLISKQKLNSLGVSEVFGGDYCTYQQQDLFFSHRRSTHQATKKGNSTAKTGRMVSAIYIN